MINCMHQLDWATGCSDIWWNIILGGSVKVFLDEISTWISQYPEKNIWLSLMWSGLIQKMETWIEKKEWVRGPYSLVAWHELAYWSFLSLELNFSVWFHCWLLNFQLSDWNFQLSWSSAFRLGLKLFYWLL